MVFKPGQSGNPSGMPNRRPFQDAINMEMAMRADGRLDPVPAASARGIVRKQFERAAKGDLASATWLAERIEGKPRAVIGGDENAPIAFLIEQGFDARQRIEQTLAKLGAPVIEATLGEDKDGKE